MTVSRASLNFRNRKVPVLFSKFSFPKISQKRATFQFCFPYLTFHFQKNLFLIFEWLFISKLFRKVFRTFHFCFRNFSQLSTKRASFYYKFVGKLCENFTNFSFPFQRISAPSYKLSELGNVHRNRHAWNIGNE